MLRRKTAGNLFAPDVRSIPIPARDTDFVAKREFSVDREKDADLRIVNIGGNFDEYFKGKKEPPAPGNTLVRVRTVSSLMVSELLDLFGDGRVSLLYHLKYLLSQQGRGELGILDTMPGIQNLFFILDAKKVERIAGAVCIKESGWRLFANPLGFTSGEKFVIEAGSCIFIPSLAAGRVFCYHFAMLKIRLQRVGRKHETAFRLVLTDSKNSTKSGRFKEILGSYDPRKETDALKEDRVKYWLGQGAGVTGSVHNFLIKHKVLDGKKINVLPKKTVPLKEEAPAEVKAGTAAEAPAPEAPVSEESVPEVAAEPIEESPAAEAPIEAASEAPAEAPAPEVAEESPKVVE